MAIEGGVWCGSEDFEGDLEDPKKRTAIEDERACYELTGGVRADVTHEPTWHEGPQGEVPVGFTLLTPGQLFPLRAEAEGIVTREERQSLGMVGGSA